MLCAHRLRFGKLIEDMENSYLQGNNKYPTIVSAAYLLLSNWKQDPRHRLREVGGGEISFVNDGKDKKMDDKKDVTCHRCKQKGHYANECENKPVADIDIKSDKKSPGKTQTATTLINVDNFLDDQTELDNYSFLNYAVEGNNINVPIWSAMRNTRVEMNTLDLCDAFEQFVIDDDEDGTGEIIAMEHEEYMFVNDGVVSQNAIGHVMQIQRNGLLDNQSTVDVFYNKNLLSNIREHTTTLDIHCNAGMSSTKMIGELVGYGTVWYNPNGIANTLSVARVQELGYCVTFDSSDGNVFHVHKPNGTVCVFSQSPRGLYYMDTRKTEDKGYVVMVSRLANSSTKYSQRDYLKAEKARKLQKIIGWPSTKTFLSIVDRNLLPNCPVTRADIIAAEQIFGPDVGSLKGKTVRQSSAPVTVDKIDIPVSIMSRYQKVIIAADIMFVNTLPFFV